MWILNFVIPFEFSGSDREEPWVEALQQIRSLGQHAEGTLAKSAEIENMFISAQQTGGGRIW